MDAKWPKEGSYDPTQFPTQTRDRMRAFFRDGTSGANLGENAVTAAQSPPGAPPAPVAYKLSDADKTTEAASIDAGAGYPVYSGELDVYTMPDGVQFRFKKNMDTDHQHMTPDLLIESWYKVPEPLRALGQKQINVVDTYNPADAYWQTVYKDFSYSYATGGKEITFYRYDYEHDPDYVVRTLSHEIAHNVDVALGGASEYSKQAEWAKAMVDDKAVSGRESITTYGENSPLEDFAESIAEYVKNPNSFLQIMPNRGKILVRSCA